MNKKIIQFLFSFITTTLCTAQNDTPIFTNYTTAAARAKTYNNLIKNSINKNLSLALTDSTEENWEDAFETMEYLHYRSSFADGKINIAVKNIEKRSTGFQRILLEMLYAIYPATYNNEVSELLKKTGDAKVFAMCAEYLMNSTTKNYQLAVGFKSVIQSNINIRFKGDTTSIIEALHKNLNKINLWSFAQRNEAFHFSDIFQQQYLLHNTVLYSLQSSNRNYPGIVIIKDTAGNFVTDSTGKIFSVPQLARSNSNMPGYLTNGNTPQGFFRLYGFDVSKSMAIGPTENLQLTMPFETTVQHFLKDSTITDTTWTIALYKKLLPASWQTYEPAMDTYYASKIGRTEIISHGT